MPRRQQSFTQVKELHVTSWVCLIANHGISLTAEKVISSCLGRNPEINLSHRPFLLAKPMTFKTISVSALIF